VAFEDNTVETNEHMCSVLTVEMHKTLSFYVWFLWIFARCQTTVESCFSTYTHFNLYSHAVCMLS